MLSLLSPDDQITAYWATATINNLTTFKALIFTLLSVLGGSFFLQHVDLKRVRLVTPLTWSILPGCVRPFNLASQIALGIAGMGIMRSLMQGVGRGSGKPVWWLILGWRRQVDLLPDRLYIGSFGSFAYYTIHLATCFETPRTVALSLDQALFRLKLAFTQRWTVSEREREHGDAMMHAISSMCNDASKPAVFCQCDRVVSVLVA